MSDIFISYAREDLKRTRQLAKVLTSLGWKVFFDRRIPAGTTWAEYIGKELESSKCVIVVWSQASLASRFVKLEANNALNKGKLIPILIEDVSPPFEFGDVNAADLINWDGDKNSEEFRNLVTDIENLISKRTKGEVVSDRSKIAQIEEEKRFKEAEEARRKAEEENRLKEEAETRRKAEEEKRLKEEADVRRKVEEEKKKLKEQTEKVKNDKKVAAELGNNTKVSFLKKTSYKIVLIVTGIIAVMIIVTLVVNSGKDDNENLRYTEQQSENSIENSAEMQFWKDVLTNNNTVAGFKSYQEKYSNGIFFNMAQKKIDAIEDNQDWETAISLDTKDAYQEYVNNHPNGSKVAEAKQKIIDLEKQQKLTNDEKARKKEDDAWNKAKSDNTLNSYKMFLRTYPNPQGRYYGEANKKSEAISLILREDSAWKYAKKTNTIASYQSYQKNYPNGRYYNEATKLMAAIKEEATKLTIGQKYQGGIIFYIDASGKHGLIAAESDQNQGQGYKYWGVGGPDYLETGATDVKIGSGKHNTDLIVSKYGPGDYAAKICADLVLNGYDDWFLPSKDELYELYLNKDKVGKFEDEYWSSTQLLYHNKWVSGSILNFYHGKFGLFDDNSPGHCRMVRAIRAF